MNRNWVSEIRGTVPYWGLGIYIGVPLFSYIPKCQFEQKQKMTPCMGDLSKGLQCKSSYMMENRNSMAGYNECLD